MEWTINLKKILVICITFVMIAIAMKNIFVDGVYNWHIQQESFYISGLQCIAFCVVTFLCAILNKKYSGEIILIFSALFMTMQGVIVPYVTVYVYFEMICFVGFVVASKVFNKSDLIINFITGISIWGAISIIFSIMGQGTINDLRMVTVCLLIVCMLANKETYKLMPQKLIHYVNKQTYSKFNVFLVCVLVLLSLIMAAKSNVGQDFDSIWYMLNPEHMLVGKNSFYDYLGYSAFVHYYPKLVEFFFLPVSDLGDYSFLLIANVFVYNLFIVLVYKLLTFLCEQSEEWMKLMFLIVLFTLPSLTSVVPSVKGDNFGAFLTMTGFAYLLVFVRKKDIRYLVYSFLALFLSTGTKLTFLMWAGIVGVVALVCGTFALRKNKEMFNKKVNFAMLYTIISNLVLIFGVHLRTFKLTGYPIYPIMLDVWEKLGFEAKYAIRSETSRVVTIPKEEVLSRAYAFFFSPNELSHTVMSWPTNIVLIFAIMVVIVLFHIKRQLDNVGKVCITVALFEMLFAVYELLTMVQPDGNYFYFPFIVFCIACWYILYFNREKIKNILTKRFIIVYFTIILVLNVPLMFVSNWCWKIGIDPFTTKLIGDNYSDYKKDAETFKQYGYYEIAQYIEKDFEDRRVIASTGVDRLRGSVETTWSAFTDRWCSQDIIGSYENFKNYVEYANIEGFLVLHSDETFFREYVEQLIIEYGTETIIKDEGAVFYVVKYE